MTWTWPLPNRVPWEIPQGDVAAAFANVRHYDSQDPTKGYIHTGVDLYAPVGHPVHAVDGGVVLRVEDFTGTAAGSPWWLDTKALLIDSPSGTVCYGEIQPLASLKPGDFVSQGQLVGHVMRVIKKDKPQPYPGWLPSMLHLELYEKGYRGETVSWPLATSQPPMLRDPTPFLKGAWLQVTRRFHRSVPPPPESPVARRELILWLQDHPLWKYPHTLHFDQRPDWIEPKEWDETTKVHKFMDGHLMPCLDVDLVFVDPTTNSIRNNPSLNTDFRVWLEAGGWMNLEESNHPTPTEGWHDGNRWIPSHDFNLDCGGDDLQEALIQLARRVRFYYGDTTSHLASVPDHCGFKYPDDEGEAQALCKDAGDGFCQKCGFRIEAPDPDKD